MSAPLCKTFLLSSAEEAMDAKKQGIVSVLGSDSDIPARATSLRRTLSADMSSHKWLTQQGFMSPLKRSPSSHEFSVSSSVQHKKKEVENQGQFDVWSSIVSQKAEEESCKSSPPYVHPLVKRSASCLSEKSLEICTESLGSETGSDGFSSETGDMEEDKQEDQQPVAPMIMPCFDGEKAITAKHGYDVGKKSPNPSFPPPIPSLSAKHGASRRLKTRRDNGRLLIEAVSMPSLNNFHAQRQDGRLVLTFASTIAINDAEEEEVMEVEELEEEFESFGEKESEIDIDDDEEEEDRCYEIQQTPKLSSGAINVHRLAVMMNKPIWLANTNPSRPKHFDEIVEFGDEKEWKVKPTSPSPPPPVAHSLPPRPPVARPIPTTASKAVAGAGAGTAVSLNAYEYCWRRPKSAAPRKDNSLILSRKEQQQLQVLKGCKEARRSLLLWPPHCIATS
ncbi:enhancer of aba co-receptor 1 [Hibiscus trionum]|uniref:Enhancer of aba co-receptor 1 n=1 Tax=Hibiscus trionum TaxID=183268 RepID=A0A9W7MB94_HIBTR|nr:enhancer of aba co-receptor 1 [Hibiscus trionum]